MPQEHIRAHIREEGESLKNNLEEFQNRVKDALDWKVWYRKNTALALGGFAVGGFALSLLLSKPTREPDFLRRVDSEGTHAYTNPPGFSAPRHAPPSRLREAFDTTMSAALSLAADRVQDALSQAIPGFREHYSEASRRRRAEHEPSEG